MWPGPRPSTASPAPAGILGSAPPQQLALVAHLQALQAAQAQQQALHPVQHSLYGPLAPQYYFGAPSTSAGAAPGFQQPASGIPSSWDQQSLASTFSTMTLQQPPQTDWYFDSGATSHMTSNPSTLSHILSPRYPFSFINCCRRRFFTSCHCYWRCIPSWAFILIMFLFLQDLLKILFMSASLLLTTIALLNLTPLVVL